MTWCGKTQTPAENNRTLNKLYRMVSRFFARKVQRRREQAAVIAIVWQRKYEMIQSFCNGGVTRISINVPIGMKNARHFHVIR